MRFPVSLAAGWLMRSVVLYALWVALIDNVHQSDLLAGIPAALLAAALATAAQSRREASVRPRPAMFLRLPLTLVTLVTDTVRILSPLARTLAGRPSQSRFRAVRYRATGHDPADAARRALTEIGGSLAPNRYVVGVDTDRGVLLVHELAPSRSAVDALRLG
jgi:multisubunit Na+/H+ antiporter MnhE subunit